MEQITINDITIDVIRKDIKNIHLAVYPPTGKIRISVPKRIDEETIRLFIASKIHWLRKHLDSYKNQKRLPPLEYKSNDSIYYLGNQYLLNVVVTTKLPKIILRSPSHIDMYVRPNTSLAQRQKLLKEWYRTELKNIVPDLLYFWERKIQVRINEWNVKQMKTKWGTCNIQKKRIWLSLELAKKPLHLIEYVVVHELIHLLERRHNDRFRKYMTLYLPHWKALKKELNKQSDGHTLP